MICIQVKPTYVVYNSVSFDKFIRENCMANICGHHCSQYSITRSLLSLLPAPRNHWSVFCPYSFACSRMSWKWEHTACRLWVWLLSLDLIKNFRFVLIVACNYYSFLFIGRKHASAWLCHNLFIPQLKEVWVVNSLARWWLKLL